MKIHLNKKVAFYITLIGTICSFIAIVAPLIFDLFKIHSILDFFNLIMYYFDRVIFLFLFLLISILLLRTFKPELFEKIDNFLLIFFSLFIILVTIIYFKNPKPVIGLIHSFDCQLKYTSECETLANHLYVFLTEIDFDVKRIKNESDRSDFFYNENINSIDYAIFLLTKDEEVKKTDGNTSYRPYIVNYFELGWFYKTLGDKKILIFKDKEVVLPYKMERLNYIELPISYESKKYRLIEETRKYLMNNFNKRYN